MNTTILDQIYNELDNIENGILRLRDTQNGMQKQTDLEVAILTQQCEALKSARDRAIDYIDESVAILKKLKAVK